MTAGPTERRGRRRPPDALRVAAVTALVATALAVAIAVAAGLLVDGLDDAPPATTDNVARSVPASARAFVAIDLQRERLADLVATLRRLPAVEALALTELDERRARSRSPDPIALAETAPWLGREAGVAELGSGGERRDWVAVYEVRDAGAARRGLAEEIGAGRSLTHRRVLLRRARETVYGVLAGQALVGTERGVRAAIDARLGQIPSLVRDRGYRELVDRLPRERAVTAWASAAGLRERLRAPAAALAALSGAPGLRAAAAALTLGGERGRLTLRALPVREPACETAGDGGGRLLEAAPADAAAFVGIARPECVWRSLSEARLEPGRWLARFARAARRARVDVARDAPPLLRGGAAVVVTGSGSEAGALSLLVRDADRRRALELLGLLAPALAETLGPVERGSAPAFSAREVDGLSALAADVAPGLELAYAAKGDRVVVSTALEALARVVGGSGLESADQHRSGLSGRPADAAALVFLDLDQLLALAEQTGVAEGGAQLAIRDDLQRLGPVSGVVGREDMTTTAELLFQNP